MFPLKFSLESSSSTSPFDFLGTLKIIGIFWVRFNVSLKESIGHLGDNGSFENAEYPFLL